MTVATTPTPKESSVTEERNGDVRERILHLLKIYIVLTPTMIQISLGTAVKPAIWREELRKLKEEGIVIQDHTPSIISPMGRCQTYKRLYLAKNAEVVQKHSCVGMQETPNV